MNAKREMKEKGTTTNKRRTESQGCTFFFFYICLYLACLLSLSVFTVQSRSRLEWRRSSYLVLSCALILMEWTKSRKVWFVTLSLIGMPLTGRRSCLLHVSFLVKHWHHIKVVSYLLALKINSINDKLCSDLVGTLFHTDVPKPRMFVPHHVTPHTPSSVTHLTLYVVHSSTPHHHPFFKNKCNFSSKVYSTLR